MSEDRPDSVGFEVGRLFALTSEAIVVADVQTGLVVAWNPGAQRLFGYSADEAIGMPLQELVAPELRAQHLEGIARYRAGGADVLVGVGPVEVVALDKRGARLDVALSLTDVSEGSERSERCHILAVIRDMTTARRAQRDLQSALEAMEEFVATASHDLRTPLTTVLGFSKTVLDSDGDLSVEDRRPLLEAIHRGATHAARLVDDLLTLSQIRARALPTLPEDVNVASAVADALERAGVGALVEVDPHLAVRADAQHLQRILVNYLANAKAHGTEPIRVAATTTGAVVTIAVVDSGGGVPEAFVPRLFDKFTRADARSSVGAGLGLSIVRGLAEANSGSAAYQSTNEGACFSVDLPDAASSVS